jgi:tetratricopeptide (TPR) repeat protein
VEQQNDTTNELLRRLFDAKLDEHAKRGYAASVRMIPQQSAEVQRVLTNAAGHLIDGDPEAAIDVVQGASEEMQEEAAVLYTGGLAHEEIGDLPAAIKSYRLAVKKDEKMSDAWDMLSEALSKEHGPCEEAFYAVRRSMKIAKTPMTYAVLGGLHESAKDYVAAEKVYLEAISDESDASAHFRLAHILEKHRKDDDQAIHYYREATNCDPSFCWNLKMLFAMSHFALGCILQKRKDFVGAEEAFRQASSIDPEFSDYHACLGRVLRERKDFAGAAAALHEAVRLDSKDHASYGFLGQVLQELNDVDGAQAAFRQASRLNPEYPAYHAMIGQILQQRNDFAGAEKEFGDAARLDESRAEYGQLQKEMQWKLAEAERKSKKNAKKNSKKSRKKK